MTKEMSAGEKIATGYFEPNTRCWRELAAHIDATIRENNAELVEIIEWALGERGEFNSRPIHSGPYWWRKELRERLEKALARHATKGEIA